MTELVNLATGEILDAATVLASAGIPSVADASTEELAAFIDNSIEVYRIVNEAKGQASDELVARLDANARWTLRVEDWEIKAPSPDAGSVSYDVDLLREALDELVAAGVISREGAWNALEPVRASVEVSYRLLRDVLRVFEGLEPDSFVYDEIERILLTEPDLTYKLKLAGVKALLKIPDARATIEACAISVTPPRRTVKVKRT